MGAMRIIRFCHKDAIGRDKKEVKNITKTDVINQIWKENNNDYTKKDIEFIINSFINTIGNEIRNNSKVKIEGLGTFSTYFRKVHVSKSLDTGEENDISTVKYISFKPSKKLK